MKDSAVSPVQTTEPVPVSNPIQQTIVIQQNPLPISTPIVAVPVENPLPLQSAPLNNKRKFYILAIAVVLILLLALGGVIYLRNQNIVDSKTSKLSTGSSSDTTILTEQPVEEEACNSPLAPAQVRPYVRCYYRQSKISFAEAKEVESRISGTVGSLIIPKDLVFEHEEVYRGIPIKWTSGQPISENTLTWLKRAIDVLPDYFYIEHPLNSIISATDQELGSQTVIKPGPDTLAYASGLNIFIAETLAKGGSTYYPVDKDSAANILFHEWVHVVQHYEALETFTEEYLAKNTLVVAMATGPLEKGFAKEVGWVYNSDEFGDGIIAKLKDDSESQKTTDYGKTKVREDMAESGALFMLCKSDQISEARILWWEKTTGKNRNEFCPSKI